LNVLRSLWRWIVATLILIAALRYALPEPWRPIAGNIVSFVGILLLSIPAIRINEQGRLIERVRSLQIGLAAMKTQLEATAGIDASQRKRLENDMRNREQRLAASLGELTQSKGAWTMPVHFSLYAGYVLLLGAAAARAIPI
jgi:hypothetical protein